MTIGAKPQQTHWKLGGHIARHYLSATSAADKQTIARYCEDQGILAAIVCLHLCKYVAPRKAREFIRCMIANVESD